MPNNVWSGPSLPTGCQTQNTGLVQGEECRLEVDETRERHAAGEDLDLLPVAPNTEAGGSHLQATAEKERIVDWTQDLREIRRVVEFLVRRERKLDVKADVAVRRLERLEKEHSQLEDEEREASLPDALPDRTKVVMLVCRQVVRRQRLRLWKSPRRRSHLHPRQLCPRWPKSS